MGWVGWTILGVVNIPLFVVLAKLFFKDMEEFEEAIYFLIKPDFMSFFQGEWLDDWWAEMKLGACVALCAGAVWAEGSYLVVPYLMPMFQ
jgi:hypothetical protein